MGRVGPVRDRVSGGTTAIAAMLLLGVLGLAYGVFGESRVALWAGGMITLAGVASGVLRLVVMGKRST
jgi:hypothetical protein